MKGLLYKFFSNIKKIFLGQNLLWHMLAVVLTWIIVESNIDWLYFTATRDLGLNAVLFPAAILGGILPFILPVCVFAIGLMRKNKRLQYVAWGIGQAALMGSFISSVLKFFTGRVQPNLHDITVNVSHSFNFGFGEHGIFWGWPSSHTAIAFAMAVAIIYLFPDNKKFRNIGLVYATYVGIGMSMLGFHWLSESVAGAIIGVVIGVAVGKTFKAKLDTFPPAVRHGGTPDTRS